jgi:hypothetical protein
MKIELTEEEASLILQVLFRFETDLPLTIEADKKYQLAENIISKIGKELN